MEAATRTMYLHVLNGDTTRMILERSGLPGTPLVWADVLHEGPAPAGLSRDAWRRMRADHHAASGAPADAVAAFLAADDHLERHADYGEVVFWFEHDLFDQLLLVRHLEWLSRLRDRSRFSLICIDGFPGHPGFKGLGELSTAELASLFPARQPITDAQVDLGARLWRAFGDADPRMLANLVLRGDTSVLPFAAGALRRHLEDFPSALNGLSRTECQILAVVRDGHATEEAAFRAAARLEERVYMGDFTFFQHMRRLTRGRAPLLRRDGTGRYALTGAGRAVLAGEADYIVLNGIDRWMGGTHLTDGRYRWDGTSLGVRS
jgi:hypothetical protein